VEALGAAGELRLSRSPERHAWLPPGYSPQAPLYLRGAFQSHLPQAGHDTPYDAPYDRVACLYDTAFADIRVRADEWAWLDARTRSSQPLRVLDVGCGNGALLCQLAPRLQHGLGVDVSGPMLERARRNAHAHGYAQRLRFERVTGPALPAGDQSVELVLSLLSFRYLDWEPLRREVQRVLSPGGRWLIVDMVQSRCALTQLPALASSKWRTLSASRGHPAYRAALQRLVSDADWQRMLAQHPMRSEQEVSRYLLSRFPRGELTVLNVGLASKVLAFDSGPLSGPGLERG
jgi:ubiquinone/menaquinone biosynthesis C-methylase UbiE